MHINSSSLLAPLGKFNHFPSMASSRISTALLCAWSSSTFASCITAVPTFLKPSAVRFALVMCFKNEPKLTPEYCLAYPYVAILHVSIMYRLEGRTVFRTYVASG